MPVNRHLPVLSRSKHGEGVVTGSEEGRAGEDSPAAAVKQTQHKYRSNGSIIDTSELIAGVIMNQ